MKIDKNLERIIELEDNHKNIVASIANFAKKDELYRIETKITNDYVNKMEFMIVKEELKEKVKKEDFDILEFITKETSKKIDLFVTRSDFNK